MPATNCLRHLSSSLLVVPCQLKTSPRAVFLGRRHRKAQVDRSIDSQAAIPVGFYFIDFSHPRSPRKVTHHSQTPAMNHTVGEPRAYWKIPSKYHIVQPRANLQMPQFPAHIIDRPFFLAFSDRGRITRLTVISSYSNQCTYVSGNIRYPREVHKSSRAYHSRAAQIKLTILPLD